MLASVLAVLLELLLDSHQGVAGLTALQPGQGSADPFEELQNGKDMVESSAAPVGVKKEPD